MTAKNMSEQPLPGDFQSYGRTFLTYSGERHKITTASKTKPFQGEAMNDHKAIHIYRQGTPSARQIRGYTREPDQRLPDHMPIMKLDSELVEQNGTQRRHRASINCILKADYAQINHLQRFADHTLSSRYRASRASSTLRHSKRASVHRQTKDLPS